MPGSLDTCTTLIEGAHRWCRIDPVNSDATAHRTMRIVRGSRVKSHKVPTRQRVFPLLVTLAIVLYASWLLLIFPQCFEYLPPYFGIRPSESFVLEATSVRALSDYGAIIYQPFCAPWNINVDAWWSAHPDWELALQNATHQCFHPILDLHRSAFLKQLHDIQHGTNCQEEAHYKKISGSGWGIDMAHVIDGLQYAVNRRQRVHMVVPLQWQYLVGKPPQLQDPLCPAANLDCYFLPMTTCSPDPHMLSWTRQQGSVAFHYPWRGFSSTNAWLLEYATRPQTWLRKQAFDLASSTGLLAEKSSCIVLHVRRNDVVRHGKFSRRYHPVREYVDAAQRQGLLTTSGHNVLLLTDDANAVIEAKHYYPEFHWHYLERPRHHGNEGGWEHHIPSNNASLEVAILHASFVLVQHCNALVHSKSNLADYFLAVMRLRNPQAQHIDIDKDKLHQDIHNERNSRSIKISRNAWL